MHPCACSRSKCLPFPAVGVYGYAHHHSGNGFGRHLLGALQLAAGASLVLHTFSLLGVWWAPVVAYLAGLPIGGVLWHWLWWALRCIAREFAGAHLLAYIEALLATGARTKLLIMASPVWPEIGDNLGLALEELFTGTKTDVQATLDEAAFAAEDTLRHAK